MNKLENFFEYNNKKIYFKIILKKKKNISIKVDKHGEVLIFAPYGIDYKYIYNLVEKNSEWILKQIDKNNEKSLFDENKIIFKGDIYNIIINIKDREHICIKDNFIIIDSKSNNKEYVYKLISNWYKKTSMDLLPSIVYSISSELNLNPNKILIKNQKTIWGSCNSKKVISLNWRLILMKKSVIDYIIIHELCHIAHMNHSKDFWSLVEKYDPNYEENKLWLKQKGAMLMKIQ